MITHTSFFTSRNGKLLLGALLAFCAGPLTAGEKPATEPPVRAGWVTDFDSAKQSARAEGKDLLLEFTRAKGCGWCIRLEKEVLTQQSFQKQVPKDFVLVELEFPRDRELPEELKKQNKRLFRHYGVRTFPYVVLCDASGRPYAGIKYENSNAEDFLKTITSFQKQRNLRDQTLAAAAELEGDAKARMLEKGLSYVDASFHRHYPEVIDAISQADPDDTSGVVAKVRSQQVSAELASLLRPLYKKEKFDEVPASVDQYIEGKKLQGESLQVALVFKTQALYYTKQRTEAMKVAEEILAINDTSHAGRYAKMLVKRIQHLQAKEAAGE
ncbi:thioredoxin family protein [Verrucomicrobiaceae bacterium R5-34]|nr:thioredoxin family protein [Verrucomicrobiaceae bacterium R5-34]